MNILILEDEHLVAQSLIKIIRQLEPNATIEGPLVSVKDAKDYLAKNKPELIISDIQLADGISIDVFNTRELECPIIFTTAFNEYAIRAFKVNSIDYLLKPIDKNDLQQALSKFHLLQSKYGNEAYLRQINELFQNFNNNKNYKERFTAHIGRSTILMHTDDIAYFSKEEVIYLIHKEGRKLITDYRSLDEIEELLDPKLFFRANRQTIISLPYIESMRGDETGKILIKLKIYPSPEFVISKEKAAQFRKWVEC